jgi:hypothetical protein
VLDRRIEPHVRLAHPHARGRDDLEAVEQRLGERGRQRLEQEVRAAVGELTDERRDGTVVDRVLDPVRCPGPVRDLEPDVEEEALPVAALVLVDAVVAVQLQAGQLDGGQDATAFATASASTVSRTSWTRRIVAPRS